MSTENLTIESALKELPTKTLVAIYNHFKQDQKYIHKFESRDVAEKRVLKSVAGAFKPADLGEHLFHAGVFGELEAALFGHSEQKKIKKPAPDKTKPHARRGLPGPNGLYAGMKLYKKVRANPRRPSTFGHASFELIVDGMTYEQYRLKGGRSNDLAWDVKHGYVEVRKE